MSSERTNIFVRLSNSVLSCNRLRGSFKLLPTVSNHPVEEAEDLRPLPIDHLFDAEMRIVIVRLELVIGVPPDGIPITRSPTPSPLAQTPEIVIRLNITLENLAPGELQPLVDLIDGVLQTASTPFRNMCASERSSSCTKF